MHQQEQIHSINHHEKRTSRHFSFTRSKLIFSLLSLLFSLLFLYAIIQSNVPISPMGQYQTFWSWVVYYTYALFALFTNIFVWYKK